MRELGGEGGEMVWYEGEMMFCERWIMTCEFRTSGCDFQVKTISTVVPQARKRPPYRDSVTGMTGINFIVIIHCVHVHLE